jgi:4-hydroxythreonine-4-phosphate dehydrogenase
MAGQALLAVSLGDPAGVGPELIAEAWARRKAEGLPPFAVIGGARILAGAAASRGLTMPLQQVGSLDEAASVFDEALPVLGDLDGAWNPGQPSRDGAALASLGEAARLTAAGEADALVTGPISKARLAEVGFAHPGQTEFVAEAAGVDPVDAVMMLAGPHLRTVPLTVHIPIALVAQTLTAPMIERKGRIVALALIRDFGIANPRLAIAALNPHAGEEGRMGDEEARLIAPAIAHLQAEGIAATGPHPADALFAPRARETYDAVLCMYHDQALIPLKALDFDAGVNVTLGLPIIRTSADHGTAFALAGKGTADPGATIAALRMAGECAARRFGR